MFDRPYIYAPHWSVRSMSTTISEDERENMLDTQIEMGQDEDVRTFEIDDRRNLLDKVPKKINKKWSSMLGKACVLSVAGVLFILMLVELWSDYGTAISTQTLFPPKVHNVMETCPMDGTSTQLTKDYNALKCAWECNNTASTLSCNGNLPKHPMVISYGTSPYYDVRVDTDHVYLTWQQEIRDCVRLIIWSI